MILPDVNVLIYAFRKDSPQHHAFQHWLSSAVNDDRVIGLSSVVLSGFLRIVTNGRAFRYPSTLEQGMEFLTLLRGASNAVDIVPGPLHWGIFVRLCREANAKAGLIPDAWFAALAIESGAEWITADRDFARFPGLRWRHPLAG